MADGKIMFIGAEDEAEGFMLAGLGSVKTLTEDTAEEMIRELSDFTGLILLTDKAENLLGDKKALLESEGKIIHRIAGKPGGEYETIDRIVRNTIGFDLKKKRNG
ncbi:MAG: V-type ATP synthase subunit F [Candidatus Altiarchaeota archaeon]